jgi:TfoX/Sxy family transcriptional regulator of competence genes
MARTPVKRSDSAAKTKGSKAKTGKAKPPTSVEDPLAGRVRELLARLKFTEQRMFGGICFMLGGNMLVGASRRGLLVRVGKERHEAAANRPHARPMEMRGRVMEGYIYVDSPGTKATKDLRRWIDIAVAHVATLPTKAKQKAKAK